MEVSGKARWPGSCAKDANRRDGEPPVAPRLVPGANLSSSRDGNSRPLWATAAQRTTEASTTEKGAPRSTTREDTTRSNIASPPHFGASSLSTACVDQLVHHSKAAAPEPSGGSSASAACPEMPISAEMPIEAAHGAAAAACATLPAASSYPRTLPRPCRAPGATLRRRKRLLQRQRDHIAAIQPLIEIAEQYILPWHHSRFGASSLY